MDSDDPFAPVDRTWTLNTALPFVMAMSKAAYTVGYGVGLTGSILYRGYSEKDVDIILYPMKTAYRTDHATVIEALGLKSVELKDHAYLGDSKTVFHCEYNDRRVDVFFME